MHDVPTHHFSGSFVDLARRMAAFLTKASKAQHRG